MQNYRNKSYLCVLFKNKTQKVKKEIEQKMYAQQQYVRARNDRNYDILLNILDEDKDDYGVAYDLSELISTVCADRHEMHISADDIWGGSTNEFDFEKNTMAILDMISQKFDVEGIESVRDFRPSEIEDIVSYETFQSLVIEGVMDEDQEQDNYNHICRAIEAHNSIVEEFLQKIDEILGTDYCPTGLSRKNF